MALTQNEEIEFLKACKGHLYEPFFKFYLYSGVRPGELKSVRFITLPDKNGEYKTTTDVNDVGAILVENEKLKSYQTQKTRILPIFPKLKEDMQIYLKTDFTKLYLDNVRRVFKEFSPKHSLKDLRHTFATRAQQCRCNVAIVSIWLNHTSTGNTTQRVYTHFTFEDQIEESKKFIY